MCAKKIMKVLIRLTECISSRIQNLTGYIGSGIAQVFIYSYQHANSVRLTKLFARNGKNENKKCAFCMFFVRDLIFTF